MSKAWPKSDGAEGEMGLILKQLDLIGSPYSQVSPHYLEPALKLMQNVIMLAIFEAAFEDTPPTVICGRQNFRTRELVCQRSLLEIEDSHWEMMYRNSGKLDLFEAPLNFRKLYRKINDQQDLFGLARPVWPFMYSFIYSPQAINWNCVALFRAVKIKGKQLSGLYRRILDLRSSDHIQ